MYSLPVSVPVGSVVLAFEQSNLAGQLIVVILFLGSILAWTVMAAKARELKAAMEDTRRFIEEYRKQDSPLGLYRRGGRGFENSPAFAVYMAAVEKLSGAVGRGGGELERASKATIGGAQMNAIRTASERALSDQSQQLESQMGLLATSVTAAPFLGLLGTVWGVLDAFQGMTITGANMLATVAPGIAGALLTTVVGLLVALPSSIGYNMLTDRIRRLCVQMDMFAQEFISDIERRYVPGG
jgi:biopolymer transport protein ExbB/TolQ